MTDATPTQPRIFKIGGTRIVEETTMAGLDNEQVRELLKRTYSEVVHATIRDRVHDGNKKSSALPLLPGLGGGTWLNARPVA